jgi:hypothetical protein
MDQTLAPLFNGVGVVGVVLLVGWLIWTGRLATRREIDDIMHDRDEWRAAHRISETARQVLSDQVDELLEHSRTTTAIVRSLRPDPEAHR